MQQCLLEIKTYRRNLPKIKIVCEDETFGVTAYIVTQMYVYDIYPDHSIRPEYLGVPFLERTVPHSPLFSPEEWSRSLIEEDTDGIFLYETDDEFWERYGGLFENGQDARQNRYRLYRVVPQDNGTIRFVPEPRS